MHTALVSLFLALELTSFCLRVPETDFVQKTVKVVYLICGESLLHILFLVVSGLIWWYSFWYLFLELYSISQALTVHEALNRHRCRYLFFPCRDSEGTLKLRYKNPFHRGVLRNWVRFLAND